jgi:hypothetical protein
VSAPRETGGLRVDNGKTDGRGKDDDPTNVDGDESDVAEESLARGLSEDGAEAAAEGGEDEEGRDESDDDDDDDDDADDDDAAEDVADELELREEEAVADAEDDELFTATLHADS